MGRGEVVVDEVLCLGCGYCAAFCPTKSIVISAERFSPQGHLLPEFARPEECKACGVCAWMCPHFAIEVYRLEGEGE